MPMPPSRILLTPLSGLIVPLSQVPEPLLRRRLLGDGAAVDPTSNKVRAPLSGVVTAVDARQRRLTLRADDGLAIAIQVGTEGTAAITCTTGVGARVQAGEVIAEFDSETLAAHLGSLLTAVVITALPAGQTLAGLTARPGLAIAGETPLLTLELVAERPQADRVDLLAPLSGILVPLEEVPDAVFAQRMVGDGISIDPIDAEVKAPAAGTVSQLHAARHALTITTAEGLEVLIHVGIDTVGLGGDGFVALVAVGDRVAAGQPLLRFDPDRVGQRAGSLLTQMLIANSERIAALVPRHGRVSAGRDVVCSLTLAQPAAAATPAALPGTTDDAILSDPLRVINAAGLHARPAAVLTAIARRFQARVELTRLGDGTRPAATVDARSVVGLLSLATRCGDQVTVGARGPDAAAAVAAIAEAVRNGCGEQGGGGHAGSHAAGHDHAGSQVGSAEPPPSPVAAPAGDARMLAGVSAAPGLAQGRVYRLRPPEIAVPAVGGPVASELAALSQALATASATLAAQVTREADPARREILAAHQELLDDPTLHGAAVTGIHAGQSAAFAWRAAVAQQAAVLEGLDTALLRERATDIKDVGQRVLVLLTGASNATADVPPGSIVIAEELTPSDTLGFTPGTVLGFCTTGGGATSHVAILARSLGLPAICAIDARALAIAEGTLVILDGSAGTLDAAPDAAALAAVEARIQARREQLAHDQRNARQPALTVDGRSIIVAANVTGADEAAAAVRAGGDGVGLLRSEFLFDHRPTAPDEAEQATAYTAVATALGPHRQLVVRTLDVGGDKPLAYLPLPREDNPFLGLRGIRVSLAHPQLFRVQLRAILRAAGRARLQIMFPMVTSVDELRAARAILDEERRILNAPPVEAGVMIEVPAAALLAGQLAREADFFSIGTNDLTQYVLAMDRGHPQLARQADALHPAVLTAIRLTCEGAHAHRKPVAVCGGLAADELAVPVLIGLGVDELSVPVPAIAGIKAAVARCHSAACRELARELLDLSSAAEVRARLAQAAASPSIHITSPASAVAAARSC